MSETVENICKVSGLISATEKIQKHQRKTSFIQETKKSDEVFAGN